MQLVAYGAQDFNLVKCNPGAWCNVCSPSSSSGDRTEDLASAVRRRHHTCIRRFVSLRCTRRPERDELDQGRLCEEAAKVGTDTLELVHTEMCMAWDERTALASARWHSRDDCFMYAMKRCAPLDESVFSALATSSACSKRAASAAFARLRQQQQISCPSDAYFLAACAGNMVFLGACPLPTDRYPEFAEHLLLAAAARRFDYSNCVKKVYKLLRRPPLSKGSVIRLCVAAAGAGNLDALRYAHEVIRRFCSRDDNDDGLPVSLCDAAASYGSVSCLMYARERRYPLSARITVHAMTDLACLKYVRETCGAEWAPDTITSGEKNFATLRYALRCGALVAPLFVAIERGRSNYDASTYSTLLSNSMACCGKGSHASRVLLEDRARAALSFYRLFGHLPETVPFDVRARAVRRMRAIAVVARATFRSRHRALQRAVHRIEDAWLAYRFAPIDGRKGFDAAHAHFRVTLNDE